MLSLDSHESLSLYTRLSQLMPVEIKPLNESGLPDLFFVDVTGSTHGIEHKQVTEILAGLSHIEEQLSREIPSVDHLTLLIEGVILPVDHLEVETLGWSKDGKMAFRQGRRGRDGAYRMSYLGLQKKLTAFRQSGVDVVEVPNREAMITAIHAMYEYAKEPEEQHQTFRRTLRTKVNIPAVNPYVRSLMGLCDIETGRTFIGEETANALVASGLHRIADIATTDVKALSDLPLKSGRRIGPAMATRLKRSIGSE